MGRVAVLGKAYLQDQFFEDIFLPASSPTTYLSGVANRTDEQLWDISVLNRMVLYGFMRTGPKEWFCSLNYKVSIAIIFSLLRIYTPLPIR